MARPSLRDAFDAIDFVQGSPHCFFADGTDVHVPGITVEWSGEQGTGYPTVGFDGPEVFDELVLRATRSA